MVAAGKEASGLDKVLAYMAEQLEHIKAAHRDQGLFFEELSDKLLA